MQPASSRARVVALAAALLILPGIWLRFHALEWMEFASDEAGTMAYAYRAGHERFVLHGLVSSAGVAQPNLLVYLLALPVTLTREPLHIVAFVALWNLAGLGCLLGALWRLVPPAAALVGTALFASLPGALLFARKIWSPDFLPAGAALLLLLLTFELERPRRWATALVFVVCTVVASFHMVTSALLPCVLLWCLLLRVPLDRRGIWTGVVASLVLLSPYLWFLVSSGFDDLRSLAQLHQRAGPSPASWLPAFAGHARAALECTSDGGLSSVPALASWERWMARGYTGWSALATLLVLLRAPWLAWRAWNGLELSAFDKLLAFCALVELGLLALFAAGGVGLVPHYHAVLLPFSTLCALWLGWRLGSGLHGLPLVAGCALVVAGHTGLFLDFLEEVRLHGPPPGMRYASPFQPHAQEWRAEIARRFDEIDSGYAAATAAAQRQHARFEAATEVLLCYDARADLPPVPRQGRIETHAGPEGLEVLGSSVLDMLRLPPFALGGHGHALVRLELWSPKEVAGSLLYTTAAQPEYTRRHALEFTTRPGENVLYLEIPDPDASGSLMLRHVAARWVLRAVEVRRVE